jgi:hypothetical protein
VKPEPILSGLEAVGAEGQGPQWAVEPVEEEEDCTTLTTDILVQRRMVE